MRLIDADGLFDALETDKANLIQSRYNADQISRLNMALCSINIAPTIDAAPVVHGRWKRRKNWMRSVCSACSFENDEETRYYPNCGAKMDM